jgi:hypothetical protein
LLLIAVCCAAPDMGAWLLTQTVNNSEMSVIIIIIIIIIIITLINENGIIAHMCGNVCTC